MGTVTEMPQGETKDAPPDAPDYVKPGAQLSFKVGGKRPTEQTLRLLGGKTDVEAQDFQKGQRVELRVVGVVRYVKFTDKHDDATGQVVSCTKDFGLRIEELSVVGVLADVEAA